MAGISSSRTAESGISITDRLLQTQVITRLLFQRQIRIDSPEYIVVQYRQDIKAGECFHEEGSSFPHQTGQHYVSTKVRKIFRNLFSLHDYVLFSEFSESSSYWASSQPRLSSTSGCRGENQRKAQNIAILNNHRFWRTRTLEIFFERPMEEVSHTVSWSI